MWLEAIITQEDLAGVIAKLLPVKIYLNPEGEKQNPERWLLLCSATQVALVPDEGLRITCAAEFSWTIAGLNPVIKLDEIQVLLRPALVEKHKGVVLEFQLQVEETDFHSLPDLVDSTIAKAVNAALATKKLPWNVTETLTHVVGLGTMFGPVEALTIGVDWGKQRITAEALALVISFTLGFVRSD